MGSLSVVNPGFHNVFPGLEVLNVPAKVVLPDTKIINFKVRQPRTGDFHWGSLGTPQNENDDDGVVLLVGLFNLLAIIVYTAQQYLEGTLIPEDTRLINWQVQKVLDEFVLRVHSSDPTANLLSRAFKSKRRSRLLRQSNKSWISNALHKITHDDPKILSNWIKNIQNNIANEISKSPSISKSPKIDEKIYYPILNLYKHITETRRVGRAFSSSILQEVGATAKTINNIGVTGTQRILRTIIELDILRKKKIINPTTMFRMFSSLISKDNKPTRITRMKRNTPRRTQVNKHFTQNKLVKKQGIVEDIAYIDNWADDWFNLITMVAPIGLDITVVYRKSRDNPRCLPAFMCQSNSNWKNKGPIHSTVTPFLSVITSWALEEASEKSLGDSLIAIRAGWMGKKCTDLYPECLLSPRLPSIAQAVEDFHTGNQGNINKSKKDYIDRIDTDDVTYIETNQDLPEQHFLQSDPSSVNASPQHTNHSETENNFEISEQPVHKYPFERYDNPQFEDNQDVINSDRVSGMDLQDRSNLHVHFQEKISKEDDTVLKPVHISKENNTPAKKTNFESDNINDKFHQQKPIRQKSHMSGKNHHLESYEQIYAAQEHEKYSQSQEINYQSDDYQYSDLNHNVDYDNTDNQFTSPEENNSFRWKKYEIKENKRQHKPFHQYRPDYQFRNSPIIENSHDDDEMKAHNDHKTIKNRILPNLQPAITVDNRSPQANQPAFLTNPGYSFYMANQTPYRYTHQTTTYTTEKRNVKKQDHPTKKWKYSKYHKINSKPKQKYEKEKYGLMRGLPAKQVEGHAPVVLAFDIENDMDKSATSSASFYPEDAITDVYRNQLLYQYIRDQQGK